MNLMPDQSPEPAILTETDGPFVRIGSRPAVPTDVERVISWLAKVWKISLIQASQQVMANLERLMRDLQINAAQSYR
jgi:TatD DNase family protein